MMCTLAWQGAYSNEVSEDTTAFRKPVSAKYCHTAEEVEVSHLLEQKKRWHYVGRQ